MMLSNDPANRSREIEGLKPQQLKMYDLAWKFSGAEILKCRIL